MMPFTQKMLLDWAGPSVYRDAQMLFDRGAVQVVSFDPPFIRGTVSFGNREIQSATRVLADGTCENLCPCRDNTERGIICAHVIALGLALIRRAADPELERKQREEARKAARLSRVNENAYIKRTESTANGAVPARLVVELMSGWQEGCRTGSLPVRCSAEFRGARRALDQIPHDITLQLSSQDMALLYVLEDISEGPAKGELSLIASDFINLLQLHIGRPLFESGEGKTLVVNAAEMTSVLKMDLDRETGDLILMLHTELPFMPSGETPVYVISGKHGWVYGAHNFWPLRNILPAPLRSIYQRPIGVQRPSVPRFLQTELPILTQHIQVVTDITLDLFTIEPGTPRFELIVRGSPASLAVTLYAVYDETRLVAGKSDPAGHFAHPDPADLLRFTVRNPDDEAGALHRLSAVGFRGEVGDVLTPIVGCREVLNFMGRDVPVLRRAGWQVLFEGKVDTLYESANIATPVVKVNSAPGANGDWFEVDFEFDDGRGGSLTPAEIQRALLRGDSFLEKGGRTILLDANAIESMNDIFRDCASGEGSRSGSFRMKGIYASYVKSSLDALDGIDVEAAPSWRKATEQQNRELHIEPVALPDALDTRLRHYQKDGIAWLRFLETHGFCGILADEMGLGKTVQALAWLQLQRCLTSVQGKPALIVCPTSLVENWAEEAARFVPGLKVLSITGGDRHERWGEIPKADLVVTSYALLRRDIDAYTEQEFAAVVLDEAQHIKNHSTQNAIAAKRLHAAHRLVLTGTPIENSVSDLWSIMDFLMPGYLGSHEIFRQNYEMPIGRCDEDGRVAQTRLRRKLHPFMMRRLKKDVAKDLPPKIERIATCTLTSDQQLVYKELLEASQRRITDMVSKQGFQRSRMEILKVLLRLRQVCCHLDLLKLPDLNSRYPSAKFDLFFELLDEAIDGGHRVLVFSQFVSMLSILRKELEHRHIQYCYLDGSTQERMKVVQEFNTNRSIPLFLISLKAGGTGLNLTGADMVIHYDPWWNPAVEDQATDRAYRIGQQRTVYSVKLITKGTVEEKVLELQRRKQAVIDATLKSDEEVIGKLTWDDVRDLLSL